MRFSYTHNAIKKLWLVRLWILPLHLYNLTPNLWVNSSFVKRNLRVQLYPPIKCVLIQCSIFGNPAIANANYVWPTELFLLVNSRFIFSPNSLIDRLETFLHKWYCFQKVAQMTFIPEYPCKSYINRNMEGMHVFACQTTVWL